MATLTSLGSITIKCAFGKMALTMFPAPSTKTRAEGTISLFAHPDEAPPAGTISWPGEYDIEGIFIRGIGHEDGRQVSYVVDGEGIRYLFLSSPLHTLNDTELEWVGDIDVLILPIDDVKIVQHLIDVVDPRVLVPLATKDDKSFQEVLKICGAVGKEAVEEFKVKSLPAEGREVVILSAGK